MEPGVNFYEPAKISGAELKILGARLQILRAPILQEEPLLSNMGVECTLEVLNTMKTSKKNQDISHKG